MVFLHFPSKLTEEELMLQSKFAKLRKKKKQVAAHQNPSKASEEKSILSSAQNRLFYYFIEKYRLWAIPNYPDMHS